MTESEIREHATIESPNKPEPMPNPVQGESAAWDLVRADIRERDAMGTEKYGQRLTPGDGRDSLLDSYQEALDLVVYLRKAIRERELVSETIRAAEARATAAERERCAKIAESVSGAWEQCGFQIAQTIRRGEPEESHGSAPQRVVEPSGDGGPAPAEEKS